MIERLQKILAAAGVASRRESESIILAGRVKVNDILITELGAKVDPTKDIVKVDDKPLQAEPFSYVLLNKPRGFAATKTDPHLKKTIMELIPQALQHLYPVGRLDVTSEGLILMTNDGELANILTHPRYEIPKTYRIVVNGLLEDATLQHLADGVKLEDGVTKPASITMLDRDIRQKKSKLEMTIWEGKNRQIRRMFETLGFQVIRLMRINHGPLSLDGLRPGRIRDLTEGERAALEELRALYDADKSSETPQYKMQHPKSQSVLQPDAHRTSKSGSRRSNRRDPRKRMRTGSYNSAHREDPAK